MDTKTDNMKPSEGANRSTPPSGQRDSSSSQSSRRRSTRKTSGRSMGSRPPQGAPPPGGVRKENGTPSQTAPPPGVAPTPSGATSTMSGKKLVFQKVAIFVDAENIEMSGLKHHEGRTDYSRIIEQVGDREIIRILYYKPAYKEISKSFESFWRSLGGEIKKPQKNADTFLVIDAVTLADKIDVAIILGGDKDFLPLFWYLRSRGCRVECWSWPETTSPEVQAAADVYVPLTEEYIIPL